MWKQLLLYSSIFISYSASESSKNQLKFIPYGRVLKVLIQEPPLSVIPHRNAHVEELWLEQKLDHSEASKNNQTFLMRYMRNGQFYKPGGPIIIFIGGEWQISKHYLLGGHIYDLAQEHSGMLYYTEHRYYGKSWPFNDTETNNLEYLSVRQSLADLEYFIRHQKATNETLMQSKVVLTGGSYSGSMAAWFHKLYPNLVAASWASSAPLQAKLDFYEYMEETAAAIRLKGGVSCYNRIRTGIKGLVNIVHSPKSVELMQRLKVCSTFDANNDLDTAAFFNGIGNHFASLVQNYSSRIRAMCTNLMTLHRNSVEAFILYIGQVFWPATKSEYNSCLDLSYQGMKQIFSDIHDKSSATRQWFYQTCNEFGWFTATASSSKQPFAREVPVSYFQQLCNDVFGTMSTISNLSVAIEQTNNLFGGLSSYDNVFFTHGQLDPWRAAGIQHGKNVYVIPNHSHAADLGSINVTQPVQLNIAKVKVAAFVQRQLNIVQNK